MSLSRPKSIAGRVHLSELVSEGLVKDGQIVHLYYRQAYANEKAQILTSENKLKYLRDSKVYSVSELARELLLKNHCIKQKYDVQGPKYWQTESGQTLDELNEIIRKKRGERG
jgi:thymidylate synthase